MERVLANLCSYFLYRYIFIDKKELLNGEREGSAVRALLRAFKSNCKKCPGAEFANHNKRRE